MTRFLPRGLLSFDNSIDAGLQILLGQAKEVIVQLAELGEIAADVDARVYDGTQDQGEDAAIVALGHLLSPFLDLLLGVDLVQLELLARSLLERMKDLVLAGAERLHMDVPVLRLCRMREHAGNGLADGSQIGR